MNSLLILLFLAGLSSSQVFSASEEPIWLSPICPFKYQSRSLSAYQWFNIFTLCLTPLAIHIAGGVPAPVLFEGKKPHWTQRLPLFNPVSILWRYYAIADRRIRWSSQWNGTVLAASNAIFWHKDRWNGSEDMIEESTLYLASPPSATRANFLSVSTLTTLIVAVQGVSAFYMIAGSGSTADVSTLFYPLACLGLYRLQSAIWLSNDVAYTESRHNHFDAEKYVGPLYQTRSWRGILFRVWWMGSILTLAFFGVYESLGQGPCGCTSVSSMAQSVFYGSLTVGMALIYAFYVLRGKSTTTIIPCVQSTWYKIYTMVVMLSAVACIVLSSLETHLEECRVGFEGTFTTCPPAYSVCFNPSV